MPLLVQCLCYALFSKAEANSRSNCHYLFLLFKWTDVMCVSVLYCGLVMRVPQILTVSSSPSDASQWG